MNVSIIGPEGSGKTTFALYLAKRLAFGRPIYFLSELKMKYPSITPDQFRILKNCIVIIDDANAFMDNFELSRKNSPYRKPVVMSRHWNRLNIFVFHSLDDSVKFLFRQSRFVYISKRYRDSAYQKSKFLKGINPGEVGRNSYKFWEYKRY